MQIINVYFYKPFCECVLCDVHVYHDVYDRHDDDVFYYDYLRACGLHVSRDARLYDISLLFHDDPKKKN